MTLRVAIIGCGLIGDVHAWALWGLRKVGVADVRVTLVHDLDRQRADAFAQRHRATTAVTMDEALDGADAVYVCTPTAAHLEVVEAAASRGLPVYCEKPLGPDLASAQTVAAALCSVPHQVGLVLRSSPALRRLHTLVGEHAYGRPMTFLLRDDQYFPIQGQYGSTWRADAAIAGGGTLIEHSIHDLDLFRWIFGDPASVACTRASFFGHEGIEDLATVLLSYADGRTATLVSVWHQILTRPSTRRFEVFFEDAFVEIEADPRTALRVQDSDGTTDLECSFDAWVNELPVPNDVRLPLAIYADAGSRFCALVSSGTATGPGATEALAAHRLVDAAYRSAGAGGTPVALGSGTGAAAGI